MQIFLHPIFFLKNGMFSGLTGLADKLSSLIREPVTPLGNAVHDCIYASGYGTSQFQKVFVLLYSCVTL